MLLVLFLYHFESVMSFIYNVIIFSLLVSHAILVLYLIYIITPYLIDLCRKNTKNFVLFFFFILFIFILYFLVHINFIGFLLSGKNVIELKFLFVTFLKVVLYKIFLNLNRGLLGIFSNIPSDRYLIFKALHNYLGARKYCIKNYLKLLLFVLEKEDHIALDFLLFFGSWFFEESLFENLTLFISKLKKGNISNENAILWLIKQLKEFKKKK